MEKSENVCEIYKTIRSLNTYFGKNIKRCAFIKLCERKDKHKYKVCK